MSFKSLRSTVTATSLLAKEVDIFAQLQMLFASRFDFGVRLVPPGAGGVYLFTELAGNQLLTDSRTKPTD